MRLVLSLVTLLTFTSCANYINKMHSEFDRADGRVYAKEKVRKDTFDRFRQQRRSTRPSTSSRANVLPQVKRQYVSQQQTKRRYTANDLVDNSSNASLWSGSGNDNYLFTKNKWKRNGDIVLINVKSGLKRAITLELKRAFPAMPKKKKTAAAAPAANQPAQVPAANNEEENKDEKTYDKISSVIIEEISKDHLLVRGQKFLLYRNGKHLIEVQALVARKDILDDDTVDSNSFLESTVQVLR